EFGELVAIIEDVVAADTHTDMAQAVELGADLADLAADELIIRHNIVRAVWRVGGEAGNRQAEMALSRYRHPLLVDAPQLIDLPLSYQPSGACNLRGRDPVRGAALVFGAELRGPEFFARGRLRRLLCAAAGPV